VYGTNGIEVEAAPVAARSEDFLVKRVVADQHQAFTRKIATKRQDRDLALSNATIAPFSMTLPNVVAGLRRRYPARQVAMRVGA